MWYFHGKNTEVTMMNQHNTKAKILVIDDEDSIRLTLKRILERKRFSVETAYDFESAKTHILNERYDLLLVDLGLPEMSGIDVIKEFRMNLGLEAPVIFITGKPELDSALDALRLGAIDYIKKPFKIDDLLRNIQNLLNKSSNNDVAIDEQDEKEKILDEIFNEYVRNIKSNIDTIKNQKYGKLPDDYLNIVLEIAQDINKIELSLRNGH